MPALKIVRFGLNVGYLERACAFYENALGFERLQSVEPTHGRTVLHLGKQELELQATDGLPYPAPRTASDPWFQHFAIAVSDMTAAYRRLSRHAQQPISQGGPQLLPSSTGSVTAYKFRDPDGHPLELSYIPHSDWLAGDKRTGENPFLGIDHSALAVQDLDASVRFYTDILGLTEAGRFLNQGPEQDRLDGLAGTRLDIVALKTTEAGPHIELLHYRSPIPVAKTYVMRPDAVAATRLILSVADLARINSRLDQTVIQSSIVIDSEGLRTQLQDPDGHRVELVQLG
jgi:catechol 2,3-dioxygenase-like lactoylglutathione lyase family enzyme